MTKPSRVIRPPRKIRKPSGQWSWEFDCDDGKTYNSDDLAAFFGLTGHGLLQRLDRTPWASPHFLTPRAPRGQTLAGVPLNQTGTAEWKALSGKDRSHRLLEIPGAGTFEQQL